MKTVFDTDLPDTHDHLLAYCSKQLNAVCDHIREHLKLKRIQYRRLNVGWQEDRFFITIHNAVQIERHYKIIIKPISEIKLYLMTKPEPIIKILVNFETPIFEPIDDTLNVDTWNAAAKMVFADMVVVKSSSLFIEIHDLLEKYQKAKHKLHYINYKNSDYDKPKG